MLGVGLIDGDIPGCWAFGTGTVMSFGRGAVLPKMRSCLSATLCSRSMLDLVPAPGVFEMTLVPVGTGVALVGVGLADNVCCPQGCALCCLRRSGESLTM